MTEANNFGYGFMQPGDAGSRYNVIDFLIRQKLSRVRTATLVQIKTITGGGVGRIGTVDALPLVNMVDGNDNATKHKTVYGLLYFRLQGGANAVIMDPAVNDIGVAVICDRDISSVQATLKQAAPSSGRSFDLADGIYFGCALSGSAPTQYVQFTSQGITLADSNGNKIAMTSVGINLNGTVIDKNGNLQLAGAIEAVGGGIYTGNILVGGAVEAGVGGADHVTLQGHKHTTVTGTGTPTAPIPGT